MPWQGTDSIVWHVLHADGNSWHGKVLTLLYGTYYMLTVIHANGKVLTLLYGMYYMLTVIHAMYNGQTKALIIIHGHTKALIIIHDHTKELIIIHGHTTDHYP